MKEDVLAETDEVKTQLPSKITIQDNTSVSDKDLVNISNSKLVAQTNNIRQSLEE